MPSTGCRKKYRLSIRTWTTIHPISTRPAVTDARYAKRHRVPWELVAITGDEQLGALLVPFDPDSFSVPITLFVRRDGKVAGGHRGYVGPTGGPDHAALRAEFERLTRTIVESAGR